MGTLRFGDPDQMRDLTPEPGKGHPIVLHYPEGNVTYLTDQLGMPNVTEYSAFLMRILNDVGFNPAFVPTPGWMIFQIQRQIEQKHGKLPTNWQSIHDQMLRAYDAPLRAFLSSSEAGRKRSSRRAR